MLLIFWNYWIICIRSKTQSLRNIKPSSHRRDWGLQTCRRTGWSLSFCETGTHPSQWGPPGPLDVIWYCQCDCACHVCHPPLLPSQSLPFSFSITSHKQCLSALTRAHSFPPSLFSQFGTGQCWVLRMTRNEAEWKNALLLTLPLYVTMNKFQRLHRKQRVEPTDILQIPGHKLRIFPD